MSSAQRSARTHKARLRQRREQSSWSPPAQLLRRDAPRKRRTNRVWIRKAQPQKSKNAPFRREEVSTSCTYKLQKRNQTHPNATRLDNHNHNQTTCTTCAAYYTAVWRCAGRARLPGRTTFTPSSSGSQLISYQNLRQMRARDDGCLVACTHDKNGEQAPGCRRCQALIMALPQSRQAASSRRLLSNSTRKATLIEA